MSDVPPEPPPAETPFPLPLPPELKVLRSDPQVSLMINSGVSMEEVMLALFHENRRLVSEAHARAAADAKAINAALDAAKPKLMSPPPKNSIRCRPLSDAHSALEATDTTLRLVHPSNSMFLHRDSSGDVVTDFTGAVYVVTDDPAYAKFVLNNQGYVAAVLDDVIPLHP